jgi:uracil-DNA glycosylase
MTLAILLLAEAYGEAEARHNAPLIGASGIELIRMLAEAEVLALSPVDHDLISLYYQTNDHRHIIALWANHPEIHRTNVFNLHPPGNNLGHFLGGKADAMPGYPPLKINLDKRFPKPDGQWVRREFAGELERLGDELCRYNPNVVVCLGNVSLWALTGKVGVSKLRGTTLTSCLTVDGFKLLPTYHPAAILRNWDNRPVVIADLMKAHRESKFPEIRRPHREIWIEPDLDDIREFISKYIRGCNLLSVDIETSGTRITCIGFAPDTGHAIVIPFDDSRATSGNYWQHQSDEKAAWEIIRDILGDGSLRKLFQNGCYDIAFLWRSMKIKVNGAAEDTMLLNHALQPESLKSLAFLGSVFSNEPAWKGMNKHGKTIKRDN